MLAPYASVGEDRVEAVLDEVGLIDRAADRSATYSQGMKQRLGVAAALLKDPELLILYEPSNGSLRPPWPRCATSSARSARAGARSEPPDGRSRARHRPGRGDRDGALVAEGTVEELRGRAGLKVRAEPLPEAARVIRALPDVDDVTSVDACSSTVDTSRAPAINRLLVEAGIAVSELDAQKASLEHVFLELTKSRGEPS